MATKPSLDGYKGYKAFCKIAEGNGFIIVYCKSDHVKFRKGGDVITLPVKLRNELAWNVIRKFKLEWEEFI